MFLKIVTGVREHLDVRFLEWASAGIKVYYGSKLIGENDAWTNAASWKFMLRYFTENEWGWIAIALGVVHLAALFVNGTFAGTRYAVYSPLCRALASGGGAVFWFMIFLSTGASQAAGSGIYPLPLILAVWSTLRASREVGRSELVKQH